MRAVVALLLALGVGALGAGEAGAQAVSDPEVARRAHGIASDVMSPYCPGRTLADCPSPNAAALREEVRELLGEGVPEAEVRERLDARFGDEIVGAPRSVWGWSFPAAVLALGVVALVVALRRLSAAATDAPVTVDPEVEAELERDLSDRGL
jgi:cytochrome c-type biogenesis protein CcmH/NrfF